MKLATLSVTLLALAIFPLAAHAQTVFSDSFENYGTGGYNLGMYGYGTSNWNNVTVNNGGPSQVVSSPIISGQDGTYYAVLGLAGWGYNSVTMGPGSQPPGNNTDTLTSVNNNSNFVGSGDFAANTTYTLSVLVAATGNITPDISAVISIDDGTTLATLGSTTITGSELTTSFVTYTATYTTGASGGSVGDPIQIALEGIQDNAYTYGQQEDFDNVVLTATPEPSATTYALLGLGLGLAVLVIRSRKSHTSRL